MQHSMTKQNTDPYNTIRRKPQHIIYGEALSMVPSIIKLPIKPYINIHPCTH